MKKETIGILLGFIGGIGMGASHYGLSLDGETVHPFTVYWHVTFGLLLIALLMGMKSDIWNEVENSEIPMILLRSACAYAGRLTITVAFTYIPVYEGDMVRCTETLFVTCFAPCLLKQKLRWTVIIALVFNVIGIVLIYRPPFLFPNAAAYSEGDTTQWQRFVGIMIALLSAFFISLYKVLGRLTPRTHYRVSCVFESASHVLVGTILACSLGLNDVPTTPREWILPAIIALTFSIPMFCYTQAFKIGEAAYVGFASMSFLPTTVTLKSVVDWKLPHPYDIFGMICIVFSVFVSLFANEIIKLFNKIKSMLFRSEREPLVDVESNEATDVN
ncbi:Uncharacterised protein r2_g2817 [Pycnogonum litorale]